MTKPSFLVGLIGSGIQASRSGTQGGLILGDLGVPADLRAVRAGFARLGLAGAVLPRRRGRRRRFRVRRSLPETPQFEREDRAHGQAKLPVAVLFRDDAPDVLRVIFAAPISVVSTIFSVFTLSDAVNTMHIPRSTMLTVLVLANVVALAAIPAFATPADRIVLDQAALPQRCIHIPDTVVSNASFDRPRCTS